MKQKFCVLGNPIAHSLSPEIHQQFAKYCGIPLQYEKILVENNWAQTLQALQNQQFSGANVTVPWKEEAFRSADESSLWAQKASAANTLCFKNGQIRAWNTDGIGFLLDLQTRLHFTIAQKNICILGAGGAARALIAPILAQKPKSLYLSNRTLEKAQNLAKAFGVLVLPWDAMENSVAFDLVINATSSSLFQAEVPLPAFHSDALFYDLFYQRNGQTLFLELAQEKGARALSDGLGMLVFQAAKSFEIWHQVWPDALGVIDFLKKK